MQTLVLNLASSTDRMAFQRRQLERLGLPFHRIEAATPQTLEPPADDPLWRRWQRPMSDVEKAVLASHRMAWQRVVEAGEPHLILEDDAWLSDRATDLLARLVPMTGLDHVSLETRGRRKIIGRAPHPGCPDIRRLYQDRTGAAAYVLWPGGAAKLLARSDREAGIADAVICAAYEMSSWQAVPALAIQLDQAGRYGVPPPLTTRSSIPPRPKATREARAPHFRARRIAAQLRMAMRALGVLPRAVRVEVEPADLGTDH